MDTPEERQLNRNPGATNPLLAAALVADYEAVRNDLLQAQVIAAEYQCQLASKANDCAQLKIVLERANGDLASLQNAIGELRADRHRLANEVQRLYGVRDQYRQLMAEQKKAEDETQSLRRALKSAEHKVNELWSRLRPAVEPAAAKSTPPNGAKEPRLPVELRVVRKPDASREKHFIGMGFDSEEELEDVSIVIERKPRR